MLQLDFDDEFDDLNDNTIKWGNFIDIEQIDYLPNKTINPINPIKTIARQQSPKSVAYNNSIVYDYNDIAPGEPNCILGPLVTSILSFIYLWS